MLPEPPRSPETQTLAVSEADFAEVFRRSWILWCSASPDDQASVHEEVDKIFSPGFSFYPELEWKTRYPPPQGYEILGAWRDDRNRAFAFLLDNPGMKPPPGAVSLLLHCVGTQAVLTHFLPQIDHLKDDLAAKNGRQKSGKRLQGRLRQADTSKSLRHLMALMGPITGVINALTLYLRRLPAPTIDSAWLAQSYNFLLGSVYSGALLLLLLFIVLCGLYLGKLGIMFIRKL